jgi:hypothetical protein
MRRMRLAALCAFGDVADGSAVELHGCYGADTRQWLTERRPREVVEHGCSFEESAWSVNDRRQDTGRAARNALYQRVLARERAYQGGPPTAKEMERGALVRAHNRQLLAQSSNRHHAWLHRRRFARCRPPSCLPLSSASCCTAHGKAHACCLLHAACRARWLATRRAARDVTPACHSHFLVYAGQRWHGAEGGEGGEEGGNRCAEADEYDVAGELRGIASGNLSACPQVWVKEVDSEVRTHTPLLPHCCT